MSRNGPRVIVNLSIDTEIDKNNDWRVSEACSFISVEHGIPDLLTPLFEDSDCKPTYLLSSEVIDNRACVKILKSLTNCELGTHLHGELVGPNRINSPLPLSHIKDIQCAYTPLQESEKMQAITTLFKQRFDRQPRSFRAGRYGACANTVECLSKLGYSVDTSVTPGVIWDYAEGILDFSSVGNQPYWLSTENICIDGSSSILEVPISIYTHNLISKVRIMDAKLERISLVKIANMILPSRWLRPTFSTSSEMEKMSTLIVRENRAKEIVVLNMMFHSMEIVPGASPYSSNEDDCKKILNRIKEILTVFSKRGYIFLTLSETYDEMIRNRIDRSSYGNRNEK